MTRYAPRHTSNSAVLTVVIMFCLLAVVGVGGFVLYQRMTDSPQPDSARVEDVPPVKMQSQPQGNSPARIKAGGTGPTPKGKGTQGSATAHQEWLSEVHKDIRIARELKQVREPVKPPLMTSGEYERVLPTVFYFKREFPVEGPIPLYLGLLRADRAPAAALMPETSRVLRREALTQIARHDRRTMERHVETLSSSYPHVRLLLEDELYTKLHASFPWDERKSMYGKFQALTGVKGEWSLLQPFDDLTGPQMTAALAAAEKLKSSGLRALTPDERLVLLAAGAVDAVEEALGAAK